MQENRTKNAKKSYENRMKKKGRETAKKENFFSIVF